MKAEIEAVLIHVKNGLPIIQAAQKVYGNPKKYWRQVTTAERKIIRLAQMEYLVKDGQKKSSGIYVSMSDDMRIKINELALISNTDVNTLIRSYIRLACKEAGI